MRKWQLSVALAVASALSTCMFVSRTMAQSTWQSVAVPAYFTDTSDWASLDSAFPTVDFVVANFGTPGGPGTAYNSSYASLVAGAQEAGVTVLGYVDTEDNNGTVTTAQAETEIKHWMNWYNIDGIFFDNVPVVTSGNTTYYSTLNAYTKSYFSSALTVLNCGYTPVDNGYMASSGDIIVDFEGYYSNYAAWAGAYSYYAWVADYPAKRFWNIVHDCTSTELSTAITTSESCNAGYIYCTPASGTGDTYGTLPPTSYWDAELSQVAAF